MNVLISHVVLTWGTALAVSLVGSGFLIREWLRVA